MGHTQIVLASTLYGVATAAAAIDDARFRPADRRLLVIADNTGTPELSRAADQLPGFETLATRFDAVISYNATIAPLHPSGWAPRAAERPLWERHLRAAWGLGCDEVSLLVESIQVEPARAVAGIFGEADIDVYADGLMSYGPTRNRLEASIGGRVERLLYVDLVPGLTPILLSEWGAVPTPISSAAVRTVISEAAAQTKIESHSAEPVAIMLGQYLSALSILTVVEEQQLHLDMLHALADRGERNIIFKPHPSAPPALTDRLDRAAADLGLRFRVLDEPVLAETLYDRLPVSVVISCFSTGLMTARTLYGLDVTAIGTDLVLQRLRPFQNSNRVPLMIIDRLVADTTGPRPADLLLTELVNAVGYAMQPRLHPDRRAAAREFLTSHHATFPNYFRRRRLTALDLPGQLPHRGPSRWKRLRRLIRAVLNKTGWSATRVPKPKPVSDERTNRRDVGRTQFPEQVRERVGSA